MDSCVKEITFEYEIHVLVSQRQVHLQTGLLLVSLQEHISFLTG